jgi:hypothetical protein
MDPMKAASLYCIASRAGPLAQVQARAGSCGSRKVVTRTPAANSLVAVLIVSTLHCNTLDPG